MYVRFGIQNVFIPYTRYNTMEKHNSPSKSIETFGSSLIDSIVWTKICIDTSIVNNVAIIIPKGDYK